jgi:hypothetical protein
VWRDNFAQR